MEAEHQDKKAKVEDEAAEAPVMGRVLQYMEDMCDGTGVTAFLIVDGKETTMFCKANRLMCEEEVEMCDMINFMMEKEDPKIQEAIATALAYIVVRAAEPSEEEVKKLKDALSTLKASVPATMDKLTATSKWAEFKRPVMVGEIVRYGRVLKIPVEMSMHICTACTIPLTTRINRTQA